MENLMAEKHHCVCPWWMGYALASPLRRLWLNPAVVIAPFVKEGMTVLEPGPGMGFFTLDLAVRVGDRGKIIAVDIQQKMLDALLRRARSKSLDARIETRLAHDSGMGVEDLAGKVDLVFAFYVVHEVPDMDRFFRDAFAALKSGGKLCLVEPSGHVKADAWERTLASAHRAGLVDEQPIPRSRTHGMLLRKG
jgi:ubiquinone/menaquinone biosynthesis C-methylase UbiE